MPVNASDATPRTFTLTVNDTKPIWVYCRQTGHCGQGMVFAVNSDETPTSNHTFDQFVTLAKLINGTSANSNSNSTGQTSNNKGAASTVRASMASAALLVVAGMFVLAF